MGGDSKSREGWDGRGWKGRGMNLRGREGQGWMGGDWERSGRGLRWDGTRSEDVGARR